MATAEVERLFNGVLSINFTITVQDIMSYRDPKMVMLLIRDHMFEKLADHLIERFSPPLMKLLDDEGLLRQASKECKL